MINYQVCKFLFTDPGCGELFSQVHFCSQSNRQRSCVPFC